MHEMDTQEKSSSETKQFVWPFMWFSILLTFLAYLSVFNNDFVNWDDPFYIQKNSHIHHLTLTELRWMCTTSYMGFWFPLSWISLAADYFWGGLNPQVFHLDNLILHCLNTALVFFISLRLLSFSRNNMEQCEKYISQPGWILATAFFVSLYFGIHPLHVESVAWASERKDVLCGFFFLSGILVYLDYLSRPTPNLFEKYVCLSLFLFALLSKPMAISFPFVLLLLDDWPGGRFRSQPLKIFLEKLPFFVIALLIGLITVFTQSKVGTVSSMNQLPLDFRIMNSAHSIVFYLEKLLLPLNLVTLYPIVLKKTFSFEYSFFFLLFVLMNVVIFIYGKKRTFLITAWLYYLVTLAPAIGILQVGSQSAADRFTYLPCLGPLLLFTSALVYFFSRWRFALLLITMCVAIFWGYQTIKQVSFWKDSIALWQDDLRVYPKNSAYAYNNLAAAYEGAGRLDDAFKVYDIAILKAPQLAAGPHLGKGKILFDKGLVDEAIDEFIRSISLAPNYDEPHNYLGIAYEKKNMYSEALTEVQKALQINPNYPEAYNSLGLIYRNLSKFDKSLAAFREAIFLDPINSKYSRNLIETCRIEKF
jgi:protein O-mannosyl-transferase